MLIARFLALSVQAFAIQDVALVVVTYLRYSARDDLDRLVVYLENALLAGNGGLNGFTTVLI